MNTSFFKEDNFHFIAFPFSFSKKSNKANVASTVQTIKKNKKK